MLVAFDRCQTAAEVRAAAAEVYRKRKLMRAPLPERVVLEPPPEPVRKVNPFNIVRWTGYIWVGNFRHATALAYPARYPGPIDPQWSLKKTNLTMEDITKACAKFSGINFRDIVGPGRTPPVIIPRQIAMALIKQFTIKSLPEIGRWFSGRDHTTVLHSVRKMEPVVAAAKQVLPPDATIDAWVEASFAAVKTAHLETCRERRARVMQERAAFMQAAE